MHVGEALELFAGASSWAGRASRRCIIIVPGPLRKAAQPLVSRASPLAAGKNLPTSICGATLAITARFA